MGNGQMHNDNGREDFERKNAISSFQLTLAHSVCFLLFYELFFFMMKQSTILVFLFATRWKILGVVGFIFIIFLFML
jgi:hypothetical protein